MNETDQSQLNSSDYNFDTAEAQTPFLKRQISMLILIIIAAVSVFLIGMLGVFLGLQLNKTNSIQKRADTYQAKLLATEDGKRQLEEANNQLNSQNKDLDQKAADSDKLAADANQKAADSEKQAADASQKAADSDKQASDAKVKAASAEQNAADARKKMNEANQQLEAKLAEVQKVSNELNSKKAELEKAQRGISKFAELETLFSAYDKDAGEFVNTLDRAFKAVLENDRPTYDNNIAKLKTIGSRLNTEYDQITALFDAIKNNNY